MASLVLVSLALVANLALLWTFHDRYWYPVDEGNYAHIAERFLDGGVLHRDIQDLHPDYIHWLNAAAFGFFGRDLVSLRFPLMAAAVIQSALILVLVGRRNLWLGSIASVGAIALGVIQFPNPTAHWYCLLLATTLVCWLTWVHRPVSRLFGVGVLLGVLTLFRQLTGVWVAVAVIVIVLSERSSNATGRDAMLGRLVLAAMMAGLVVYVALNRETEPGGVLFMALWPAAILGATIPNLRITNRQAAIALGLVAGGALVGALPVLTYHFAHGTISDWLKDVILVSFGLTRLEFFGHGWYGVLPLAGIYQAVTSRAPAAVANGFYWTALPLLSAVNGLLVVHRLRRGSRPDELVLPIVAAFYALVSLHFEGPTYLYYSVGLTLASLLWLQSNTPPWRQRTVAVFAVALTVVGIHFHAGQPYTRTPAQILAGHRIPITDAAVPLDLDRAHLRVYRPDGDKHVRLVHLIQSETRPGEAIFALPGDAQLYFLSDRPNVFRFYNTALGIRSDEELTNVLQRLEETRPRVVTFRPQDKYNTHASRRIIRWVQSAYDLMDTIDDVEVYRIREASP